MHILPSVLDPAHNALHNSNVMWIRPFPLDLTYIILQTKYQDLHQHSTEFTYILCRSKFSMWFETYSEIQIQERVWRLSRERLEVQSKPATLHSPIYIYMSWCSWEVNTAHVVLSDRSSVNSNVTTGSFKEAMLGLWNLSEINKWIVFVVPVRVECLQTAIHV